MPFLRSLNRFLNLYRYTLKSVFSLGVWLPLLGFVAVSVLALLAFVSEPGERMYALVISYLKVVHQVLSSIGVSPISIEGHSHYPAHYFLLPTHYDWGRFLVGLALEGLALGLAARAFARRFLGGRFSHRLPAFSLSAWGRLIGAWVIMYLVVSVCAYGLSELLQDVLMGSPRRVQFFELGLFVLSTALLAPLAYTIPILGISFEGWNSLRFALGNSWRLFVRFPFTTFLLVFIPSFLFTYPPTWMVSPSSGFAMKLRPEVMVYLLIAVTVGNALLNFFYLGTTVKLLLEESDTF